MIRQRVGYRTATADHGVEVLVRSVADEGAEIEVVGHGVIGEISKGWTRNGGWGWTWPGSGMTDRTRKAAVHRFVRAWIAAGIAGAR